MATAINTLLTINGGSSSIKFALYATDDIQQPRVKGEIVRIGLSDASLHITHLISQDTSSSAITATDYQTAIDALLNWFDKHLDCDNLIAIGHRVVHGGPNYHQPVRITAQVLTELHHVSLLDPEHLPHELVLIDSLQRHFPHIIQMACFDTAFHHALPRVAQLLAIPRRFEALGVRKYGFHGLSYAYLMEVLAKQAGKHVATGRVILAHLGNGASLTAVLNGQSIDTSMSFSPCSGVPMSTRSGDLDPSLLSYLARTEQMSIEQFTHMVHFESGLLGISETSADMHDLLKRETVDVRAAEAIAVFCYHIKKCIGGFTASLGGLDTLVFAGGIGENAPMIRKRICEGLAFLGLNLDPPLNDQNAAVISTPNSRVTVRVIHTDEACMLARAVCHELNLSI